MKFEFELDAFDLEFLGDIIHSHVQRCLTSVLQCYTATPKGFHKGRAAAWIKRDQARCERLLDKVFADKEVVSMTRVDDYPDVDIEVYRLRFELNSAEVMYLRRLMDCSRTKYLQLYANTYIAPEKEQWAVENVRPHYEYRMNWVDKLDTLMFGKIEHVYRNIFGTET
jgi:hypothetical protein